MDPFYLQVQSVFGRQCFPVGICALVMPPILLLSCLFPFLSSSSCLGRHPCASGAARTSSPVIVSRNRATPLPPAIPRVLAQVKPPYNDLTPDFTSTIFWFKSIRSSPKWLPRFLFSFFAFLKIRETPRSPRLLTASLRHCPLFVQ